jgi:hypothetical protein
VIQDRYAALAGPVVPDLDPDAIDCKRVYPDTRTMSVSFTLGELVARTAVYSDKPADRQMIRQATRLSHRACSPR